MKKSDIILRVSPPHDDALIEGSTADVTAWDINREFMIDQHVTEEFPELEGIEGIEELSEGYIIYTGELNKPKLAQKLIELGFNVVITTHTNRKW